VPFRKLRIKPDPHYFANGESPQIVSERSNLTNEVGEKESRLRREAFGAEGCEGGGRILSLAVSLPSKP
jgi:hypothetical protein